MNNKCARRLFVVCFFFSYKYNGLFRINDLNQYLIRAYIQCRAPNIFPFSYSYRCNFFIQINIIDLLR